MKKLVLLFALVLFACSVQPLHAFDHAQIRGQWAIRQQALQMEPGSYVLLIGDSITEYMQVQTLNGMPVLNAGIGGATALQALQYLPWDVLKPAATIIMIGTNDTWMGTDWAGTPWNNFAQWRSIYGTLVYRAWMLGPKPVLITPIPLEWKGIAPYFSSGMLANWLPNEIMRYTAAWGLKTVNSAAYLSGPGWWLAPGATVDGVHPTPELYRDIRPMLEQALVNE